jgi:hypothetical protein
MALCALFSCCVAAHAQSVSFARVQTVLGYGLNLPYDVAVDGAGDVFIADLLNHRAVEVPTGCSSSACQTTVWSGNYPVRGVAVDTAGDLFVYSDNANGGEVVEIPAGCAATNCQVTVGGSGNFVSQGTGLAVDAAGDLFIAEELANTLYEVPASCIAAGTQSCWITLPAPSSGWHIPTGVAVDTAGDVFVATSGTPHTSPAVDEIPSGCTTSSCITTVWSNASSDTPWGVAVDAAGNVFLNDYAGNAGGSMIEIPQGCGSSSCWVTFASGFGNGSLLGLAVDKTGDVFVADAGDNSVVELQLIAPNFGSVNVGSSSTLTLTYNINDDVTLGTNPKVETQGAPNLDFTLGWFSCGGAQTGGSTCTVMVQFAPLAPGLRQGAVQLYDSSNNLLASTLLRGYGSGPQVVFPGGQLVTVNNTNYPSGVAVDAAGNVYFSGYANASAQYGNVIQIPAGCSSGSCYQLLGGGYTFPVELAIDGAGNIYVPDLLNKAVYLLPPGCTSSSCQTNTGFGGPAAVALDGAGDLFVAEDEGAGSVVEVRVVGSQTTLTGSLAAPPFGVALDDNNDVFIADQSGGLLELPSVGTLSQFAPWVSSQTSVLTDAAGDVYASNSSLIEVTAGCASSACDIAVGSFAFVTGLALDNQGDVYVADNNGGTLYEWQRSQAPTLTFPSTQENSTSSALTVAVQNIGNQPLIFASFAASAGYLVDAGATTCSTTASLAPGGVCNVGVDFAPTIGGSQPGTLTITDNALNAAPATQSVSLQGTGTQAPSITSVNNATFVVNSAGSFTVTSTGFPTPALSESGGLPTGVTFMDNGDGTGSLSGTPSAGGTFNIQFIASNGVSPNADQNFTLTVNGTPNFDLTVKPGSQTVRRAAARAEFLLDLFSMNGFDGKVALSCSGGPTGSSCVPVRQTVTVNGTRHVFAGLEFPNNTKLGTYSVTFTGVSGTLTNTATANLTIK